eukprot:COSAG05_NODE_8629_length_686_cov_1.136286_1_plen_47_part_01
MLGLGGRRRTRCFSAAAIIAAVTIGQVLANQWQVAEGFFGTASVVLK